MKKTDQKLIDEAMTLISYVTPKENRHYDVPLFEYLRGIYKRVKQKRSEKLGNWIVSDEALGREIMSQPEFEYGDLVHYEFGKGRVLRGFVVATSNVKRKAIIKVESGSLIEAYYSKLTKI